MDSILARRGLWLVVLGFALAQGACGNDEQGPAIPVSYAPPSPPAPPTPSTTAAPATPRPAPITPVAPSIVETKPADPLAADRWYELTREGSKVGSIHVEWSPSTYAGKATLHDRTTEIHRTVRDMLGTQNAFDSRTVSDLERDLEGRLWWMKRVVTEGGDSGHVTVSEVTWTGDGYDIVVSLKGTVEKRRAVTAEPVRVDPESFLGPRIAAKTAKEGDAFTMPVLDERAARVKTSKLAVLGVEPGPSPAGDVPCTKVRETDPETGVESLQWFDGEGAIARWKGESGELYRVTRGTAEEAPAQTASFSITASQDPHIERIFSAERTLVDVVVRPDPDRPMPEFPSSPFSRVTGVDGDATTGWTVHAELTAYDSLDARATIPVKDPAFAKDLEPTVLMPCRHPDVVGTAKAVVGKEKDARKAAEKLALWVHDNLEKESSDVNETTAVEILEQRKGDCSEHAVLFVALCRAVGIPARRCMGYVCVGMAWGAHAWAEIWTGAWIGADPTTSDVGTAARYLYFGKQDDPESHAGLVSSRATGRMRFLVRHLDEGADHLDFTGSSSYFVVDRDKRRAVHRLAGFDLRDLPADWEVTWSGPNGGTIRGPDLFVQMYARADQGDRAIAMGEFEGEHATFAGAPARHSMNGGRHIYEIGSRRRSVAISAMLKGAKAAENLKTLEKVFAPSFTPKPIAP